jgi:hypothetical protein
MYGKTGKNLLCRCKPCHNASGKASTDKYKARNPKTIPKLEFKYCAGCKSTRPSADFANESTRRFGLSPYCGICMAKKARERKSKNRARTIIPFPESSKCIDCKERKDVNDFWLNLGRTEGLSERCIGCQLKFQHALYEANRDKIIKVKRDSFCADCGITDPEYISTLNFFFLY